MNTSLAVKHRPSKFEDMTEQGTTTTILNHQIATKTFKQALLFTGPAGCGKTTSARIFANMINKGKGNPIEIDAASNNGVEDVRQIVENAKYKSIDSEYKVYIIDECHSLSNQAWQAMLKLIEEPPAGVVFVFCTTEANKVPETIQSRVQQFTFTRISNTGIKERLQAIIELEKQEGRIIEHDAYALDYIAKASGGGMRKAITLMDKCLSFSEKLDLPSVVKVLGTVSYGDLFDLLYFLRDRDIPSIVDYIEYVYNEGVDLKLFVNELTDFVLDVFIYQQTSNLDAVKVPELYIDELKDCSEIYDYHLVDLHGALIKLQNEIKFNCEKSVLLGRLILATEVFKA